MNKFIVSIHNNLYLAELIDIDIQGYMISTLDEQVIIGIYLLKHFEEHNIKIIKDKLLEVLYIND